MQIFIWVVQILSTLVPFVAKWLAAVNEAQAGGVREYERLLELAVEQVGHAAEQDWPGESEAEKNTRKLLYAIKATGDAARSVGVVVKDHQLHQAVVDAVTVWKQFYEKKPAIVAPAPAVSR